MFNYFFLLRDKPLLVYKLDQSINTLKLVKNKMTLYTLVYYRQQGA